MEFSMTVIVPRYKDTDKMGVVYHGNYFTYFEQARSDFFKELGFRYKDLEDEGIILPVISVGCEYFSPARYDEPITVKTHICEFTNVKLMLEYEIFSLEGDKVASGFTKHAFTSAKLKPVNIKRLKPELYNKLRQMTEGN